MSAEEPAVPLSDSEADRIAAQVDWARCVHLWSKDQRAEVQREVVRQVAALLAPNGPRPAQFRVGDQVAWTSWDEGGWRGPACDEDWCAEETGYVVRKALPDAVVNCDTGPRTQVIPMALLRLARPAVPDVDPRGEAAKKAPIEASVEELTHGLIQAFVIKEQYWKACGVDERVAGIRECITHLQEYRALLGVSDQDGAHR